MSVCLPPFGKGRPSLGDFIAETKKLTSQAKVVLWPESAVEFGSQGEREAAFEELRKDIQKSVIGVAFEEFVPQDSSNPSGSRMRRNGLALVHEGQKKGEEVIQYYKRNLVPCTSFYVIVTLPRV
jgi:apolipoprotein N-acyltransferase